VKILLLSSAGALGGAERVLLDAAGSIRALNPDWEFALVAPAHGDLADEARASGIETWVRPFPTALAELGDAGEGLAGRSRWRTLGRLGTTSLALARYSRALGHEVTSFDPDVIHASGFKMQVLGARVRTARSALLWHLHDYVGARPITPSILKMHIGQAGGIVANSNSVAADARVALGAGVPIHTVLNGIDLERFSPRGAVADLDTLSGMAAPDRNVVRVGLIATAARWKGHEVFLRALALLRDNLPIRAYVSGGPIYQTAGSQFTLDELRAMAVHLDVAHKAGFTGHLRDVAPAIRALDVVVHCSVLPEPFGLVIAEALASARALITTAQGGAAELITPELDALVCRANDPAGLAATLERLVVNRPLRASIGRAGRLTAERRFSRDRMGAELSAIYRNIVRSEASEDGAASARS
jgi:glycosyltransferase involved in cell wall biosynthesis